MIGENTDREIPVPEAAPLLRMSREKVVRRIQSGELRGRRDMNGRWLIEADSIAEWQRAQPTPKPAA